MQTVAKCPDRNLGNATAVICAQVVSPFVQCHGNFERLLNEWSVSREYLHLHI